MHFSMSLSQSSPRLRTSSRRILHTGYIRCMRLLSIPACLRRYSLLSSVVSLPPTLPHPLSGTTIQVQLSWAFRSSPKCTMALAARVGSDAFRARSTIS